MQHHNPKKKWKRKSKPKRKSFGSKLFKLRKWEEVS
jgi:hypothetical protein